MATYRLKQKNGDRYFKELIAMTARHTIKPGEICDFDLVGKTDASVYSAKERQLARDNLRALGENPEDWFFEVR